MPYGKGERLITVPDSAILARGRRSPALTNPIDALTDALDRPIQSARLEELARGKEQACIVISDNTRAVPNQLLLPEIVERIRHETDRIDILIANGLHPPLTTEEMEDLVGAELVSSCNVMNHFPRRMDGLQRLGTTASSGMPVWINNVYLSSDLRILTGLVEPHFMAGFSGGRKSICPGICGLQTVQFLHSPTLLESSFAAPGVLDRNPVHTAASEAAAMAPADFIVNVSLGESFEPSGFYAGDMVVAWETAVKAVEAESRIDVDMQYDVVIASNGGHPLDRNFYQTVKGLVTAVSCLRHGGRIVMLSACTDGLGTPAFKRCLHLLRNSRSLDDYIQEISRPGKFMEEQWEVEEYVKVLRRASRIVLCASGLNKKDADLAGVELFADPDEAIRQGMEGAETFPRVLALPEGPYSIPIHTRER